VRRRNSVGSGDLGIFLQQPNNIRHIFVCGLPNYKFDGAVLPELEAEQIEHDGERLRVVADIQDYLLARLPDLLESARLLDLKQLLFEVARLWRV